MTRVIFLPRKKARRLQPLRTVISNEKYFRSGKKEIDIDEESTFERNQRLNSDDSDVSVLKDEMIENEFAEQLAVEGNTPRSDDDNEGNNPRSDDDDDEYECNDSSSGSDSSYKDETIVINVRDLKLNATHCSLVGKVLMDKGIAEHFNSLCGGRQKPVVLKYIVRRTSQLLIWTHFYHFLTNLTIDSVIQWFAELIETYYMCLERFVTWYLDEIQGLSASTCYNYLCDLAKAFKWFIWYRHDRRNEYPVDGTSAGGFADLLTQLRKNLKPAQQKQRVENTLRNMVANHRFPKGGIHELRQHLEDGIHWAISISPDKIVSRKLDYNRFLSIIVNALYLFSPQGRIGGHDYLIVYCA
jgi:hypothetical protein